MSKDVTSPMYYIVDDIPVMLYVDPKDGLVYAVNDLGNPWDMKKAMIEGTQINKKRYDEECEARKAYLASL